MEVLLEKRRQWIERCLTFGGSYEDYPFGDDSWAVIRRLDTRKGFAFLYFREGAVWLNLKTDPAEGDFLRQVWPAVRPAYHMNKTHWISVVLDGSIPEEEILGMIARSHALTGSGSRKPSRRT